MGVAAWFAAFSEARKIRSHGMRYMILGGKYQRGSAIRGSLVGVLIQ
jgi:hypothetical protein